MEATDIIEICEYILKQRELAVEKDESEDWVFEYLRHIDEKLSKLEYYLKGYISKMVNSRNRINEKIIFLHVNNTEEICDLMHSFLD